MKKAFSFLLIFSLLILNACHQNDDEPGEQKTIELDEKSAELIEADNTFGFELLQKIRANSDDENIMISPLSISLALAMAYNGADGNTKTEMEHAMKLNGLTPDQINQSYKMLIKALQSLDEDVVFDIANAIFYADGFPVKNSFLDINHNYYNAEVEALDFASPSALETINNWVADKTNDKIDRILDQLSSEARMVLLNAIYFFGTWTVKFDEDGTQMNRFTTIDGTNIEVPMMTKEDQLEYTSNNLFSAVKIPYGTGQYNMMVMLPAQGESSTDLIDALNTSDWKNWTSDFELKDNMVLTMPRFKFEFETKLITVLKQMGMIDAFSDSSADFSKISDVFLYISDVIHKTYIDVNETGTEAAAVTAIVFETTSAGPGEDKFYFTVDKPFVFAITEKDTDAILFIGEVQRPEYEE